MLRMVRKQQRKKNPFGPDATRHRLHDQVKPIKLKGLGNCMILLIVLSKDMVNNSRQAGRIDFHGAVK